MERKLALAQDTEMTAGPTSPDKEAVSKVGLLYESSSAALEAVNESYLYWTGNLTDTSFQLSIALLAANWAIFGSVNGMFGNQWSVVSVALVILGLALGVIGAKIIGEAARERIEYAESNAQRWNAEFNENLSSKGPWPFTTKIEISARALREVKLWFPLAAGISLLIGLVCHG